MLAQLWAAGSASTPAEVRAALGGGLAYSTVMTILTRLWRKGLVTREPRGRAYAYRPAVGEADLVARRMRADLEHSSDRAGALSRFVGALSPDDARALRRLLEDLER